MKQRVPFNEIFEKIRHNLHFVLVEPESAGNVGAAARAMKTTGFDKLTLINPCNVDNDAARMMGHRSYDIIEKAKVVPDFNAAISDMHLVVATTMRRRYFKFPIYSPDEISEKLLSIAIDHPVAIVFGREKNGLLNDELLQCHIHSTITTATRNPALNLSQAVMIYAHTLFMNLNKVKSYYTFELATQNELEIFYDHLIKSLELVNFVPRDGIDNFITRVRRLIGRSTPEQRDVRLLHKLLQIFETRIQTLENETSAKKPKKIF